MDTLYHAQYICDKENIKYIISHFLNSIFIIEICAIDACHFLLHVHMNSPVRIALVKLQLLIFVLKYIIYNSSAFLADIWLEYNPIKIKISSKYFSLWIFRKTLIRDVFGSWRRNFFVYLFANFFLKEKVYEENKMSII